MVDILFFVSHFWLIFYSLIFWGYSEQFRSSVSKQGIYVFMRLLQKSVI